jgi:hypothetical protein
VGECTDGEHLTVFTEANRLLTLQIDDSLREQHLKIECSKFHHDHSFLGDNSNT